jgi:anti-sigma regulatory factor (Ser/Thr protein kinase)
MNPHVTHSRECEPAPVLPPKCQGKDMAEEWPLRDFLEFGPLPSAVACARWHAKHVLREWGLSAFTERVELLVSELTTNAIKASQSLEAIFPVRLWLRSDRICLLILVWDADPQPPVRVHVIDEAESGRGLVLVEELSAKWDWYPHKGMGGKVVWSLVTQAGW